MNSPESRANFVRRLPAAVLGAVVVAESAYILGAEQPLATILAVGGGIGGAALQNGAQYLADRMTHRG